MNRKSAFFSSRNILIVIACVLSAYLLLWAGVLVENKLDQDQKQRAIKAQQAQIEKLSKEEKSILKAQNYLVDNITVIPIPERFILSYLQRKFDLPSKLGAETTPPNLHNDPRIPADWQYLARIAYPDQLVKEPPKNDVNETLILINIYSANCDHLTLPSNFWSSVEENVQKGGYFLTHIALAFEFMENNNCKVPDNSASLKERMVTGMVSLADSKDATADLRYESIAFLMLAGYSDQVKQEWIDQIISEQQPDGSWAEVVGSNKTSMHTSILAIWALLEYSRPNTPDEPLIRRPPNS